LEVTAMLAVNVAGGTNAGRRIIRKPATDWECRCVVGRTTLHYRQQHASLTRCLTCGTRRP
jgi:hypothetical protein